MLLGLYLTQFDWPEGDGALGPRVAAIAKQAEDAGFAAFWPMGHFYGRPVDAPMLAQRFERLEETLQIAHQMWSGEVAPFIGTHYQLTETLCRPLPLQRPHPPILVGGGGERKTLRLVARYADACNFSDIVHPDLSHKLELLREHCTAVGCPHEAITNMSD